MGFDVYEHVGPLGRVIVRMHHFSTNEWADKKEDEREAKGDGKTTCFLFPLLR